MSAAYAYKDIILLDRLAWRVQATVKPVIAQLATIAFLPILFPVELVPCSAQESAWQLIAQESPLLVILGVIPAQLESTIFLSATSSRLATLSFREASFGAILPAGPAATARPLV